MKLPPTQIVELMIRELAVKAGRRVAQRMAKVKGAEAKTRALEDESISTLLKAKKLGWRGALDKWTRLVAWHAGQAEMERARDDGTTARP